MRRNRIEEVGGLKKDLVWANETRPIRHTKFGLGEDLRGEEVEYLFKGLIYVAKVVEIKRNVITGAFELYLDPNEPLPMVTAWTARVRIR